MSTSSAQASCRLTARRRLALGGVVLTTAIAAGALVSTPASAAPVVEVHTYAQLETELTGSNPAVTVATDYDGSDKSGAAALTTITSSKTLDLDGVEVDLDQVAVADGVDLHVIDSTATADETGDGALYVNAQQPGSGTSAITGVDLGQGATFHVTGASVSASGTDGGAGIGSDDSAPTSAFIADGSARVSASGSTESGSFGAVGGAGVGGAVGSSGIAVTVGDDASLSATGATGAAGVGGGFFGDGGSVHLKGDGRISGYQGGAASVLGSGTGLPASGIGAGQEGAEFGSLAIDADAYLPVDDTRRLVLPAGAVVENRGEIDVDVTGGASVQGTGTIHNLGTIVAHDYDSSSHYRSVDPSTAVGSVQVTGNNYAVTIDGNGGSVQGATGGRVMSASLSDAIGRNYYDYTVAEPAGYTFRGWNTAANGTGIDVADDLSVAGPSTGTPKAVTLFAKYARVPYATAVSLPNGTVGAPYRAQLPVAGDGLAEYSVSYGNSSSNVHAGLPAGLTIDRTTGVISGTPTETLDGTVTFYVQGLGGADLTYRLTISPKAVVAAPSAPSLGAVGKQTVKLGRRLSLQLPNTGGPATSYSVTFGSLPKGITLNASTGVISGTPTASGVYTAFVVAKSDAGSSSTQVQIVVPEMVDLLDTKGAVPAVKVGAAKVPLKVAGLKKGEHWTVKVDGKVVDRGTMKKAGTLAVSVKLKKARRDTVHTIVIAGSRPVTDKATRAATTVKVTSLAARKALRVHTVSANGTRLVAVEKLAAGERVVIKDGRKVIATGHANDFGIFAFPASKAGAGTSKVTVHGATAKRAGTLTVKNAKHSKH